MQSRSSTGGVAFEDLNDAEQRLYELAKQSMPLAEVAVRLGVPIGEADRRIEALLARLQLPSRVALQDGFRPPPAPVEEHAEAAPGGIPAGAAIRGSRMRALAVLAPVVVVVAVAVFVFFRFDTSDSAPLPEAPATAAATPPTVAPTASPTATATPEVIAGVEVKPLSFGPPVDFPPNVAAIIVNGCWQCDGPPSNIERVYRSTDGTLHKDILFEPARPGTQYINTFAVSADGQRLAVGVCTIGYCGGLGEATPDAEVTLRYSSDGGITWSELGKLAPDESLLDVNDGIIVGKAEPHGFVLFTYPAGEAIAAPVGAVSSVPLRSPDGLLWATSDGQLLKLDGAPILRPLRGSHQIVAYQPLGDTQNTGALSWMSAKNEVYELYVGKLVDGALTTAFSAPVSGVQIGGSIGSDIVLATVDPPPNGGNPVPGRALALVDLDTGEVRIISDPFEAGRNWVEATFAGPFARIVNTGDCLNIRESPTVDAHAIACLPDGVLLKVLGPSENGRLYVQMPDGATGWAAIADDHDTFIER